MPPVTIVLASQSPYRLRQLQQIGVNATTIAPQVDERPRADEKCEALATRLAREKALTVKAGLEEPALVIAGDQTAGIGDLMLQKPGNMTTAIKQLCHCSGQTAVFYSAVCVTYGNSVYSRCVPTEVRFRSLSRAQIDRYLTLEAPFDCAGSFKCEGLGITLFESISSDDPSALVGLPLIALTSILKTCGAYPLDTRPFGA